MSQKSAPKGFSKGLVTDIDPRYQLEGSYRDAMNVKLVNTDGTTFTIENINGNTLTLDLHEIDKHIPSSFSGAEELSAEPLNYFTNIDGLPYDSTGNPMNQCANIVGHFSFRNELVIIVCGYIFWNQPQGSQALGDFRTAFFRLVFNAEGEIEKVVDMRVAYVNDVDGNQYPNINMDPLIKCRVEGIIENDAISRIYWTDNKNPLRTFALNDPDIHDIAPSELDITPKAQHNQIALRQTISGSLPVGVYQYCYKYITDAGSESGISPLSNIYHISNTSSQSSTTYYGGTPGSLSNDGFLMKITNLDTRFDAITIYAVYYNSLGAVPQVSEIATKNILTDGVVEFRHTSLTTVIENGVENILIPTNTWDVCKDIAIKDNVLFAANLRQKRNFVTEQEWNVKVKRYLITEVTEVGGVLHDGGSLLTNDPNVRDYEHPNGVEYDPALVTEVGSATIYDSSTGLVGQLQAGTHRYLPTRGTCVWGNGKFLPILNDAGSRRNILGGVSHGYYAGANTNGLGGCMFSFRQIPKVSDTVINRGGILDDQSPFISTNVPNDTIQTDNLSDNNGSTDNVDTEYTASFTIGSNKDAHASGNKRGYQRGEVYRFGVLVYDLNGDPGNVLWIGDIKMPEHYDKAWELDLDNTQLGRDAVNGLTAWRENPFAQDYRMSIHTDMVVPGHGVQYDTTSYDAVTTENLASSVYQGIATETADMHPQIYGFSADGPSSRHYTLDLAIDFTFKIPPHVRNKISGFRICRAERTESDRTIIQSGLINQICNYGNPTALSLGYVQDDEDGGIDAKKVQAGDTASIVGENIDEIYDQVLNGYCGINAGSNSVVAKDSNNKPRYINESESSLELFVNKYGAGCGEFGSYNFGRFAFDTTNNESRFHAHTQGNAAVMYSPDSTFGVRPYAFSGDHIIRIESIMKLYSEERSNNTDLQEHEDAFLNSAFTFGYDSWNILQAYDSSITGTFQTQLGGDSTALHYQTLGNAEDKRESGLVFSSKKTTKDDESGVMVGKVAVLDTYYNPYCRNFQIYFDAGYNASHQYVKKPGVTIYNEAFDQNVKDIPNYVGTGNSFASSIDPHAVYNVYALVGIAGNSRPDYNYSSIIDNAKEIGQGEFVSKGFFTQYKAADSGGANTFIENRGFSNFTLGARYLRNIPSFGNNWMYGKIHDSGNLAYETISTLQMGTRAILLNTNRKIFFVEDVMQIIKSQNYIWNKACKPMILSDGLDALHGIVPQPVYHYANIVKQNQGQYGGQTLEAIQKTRWINAGNFHPINKNVLEHHTTVLGGDTFVGLYSHQMTMSPYPEKSYSKWIVFPCESFVNTEMRSGLHLAANDHIEGFDQDNPPFSNDWFYNDVYSQENNLKSYLSLQDNEQQYTDLPVEIAYSKTKLSGEQTDAFRIFPIFNFYDVEAIYGQINRIINFQNEIHFFQENAFGQLLVNPRTFLQDSSGVDSIFTGSGDTIESHQYISIKYGTKHMHSVVASERNIYFFDIRFAKLLKYGSDKKLVSISDDLGTRDLFEKAVEYGRLKSEERYYVAPRVHLCDMPLYHTGIHGAFDYSSNSLYMTFSDRLRFDHYDAVNNPEGNYVLNTEGIDPYTNENTGHAADRTITNTTVRYNEDVNAVISKYSVYPQQWIEHDGSLYTPKSRLPWLSYEDLDGQPNLIHGFRHALDNTFGRNLNGTYGLSKEANMTAYRYGTHELSPNPLQLWKWDTADECTVFFRDRRLHGYNSINDELDIITGQGYGWLPLGEVVSEDTIIPDDEDEYTVYNIVNQENGTTFFPPSGANFLSAIQFYQFKIIHKSFIEKVINEAPGENKKFDTLNVVTTIKSTLNPSKNILSYIVGPFADVAISSLIATDDFDPLNPNDSIFTVSRQSELFNPSQFFEDLDFETENIPRTTLEIRSNTKMGYPGSLPFTDLLHKYREGILRIPLRNRTFTKRAIGTYLRARLSARTTKKFNIFAIMAKYRKSKI